MVKNSDIRFDISDIADYSLVPSGTVQFVFEIRLLQDKGCPNVLTGFFYRQIEPSGTVQLKSNPLRILK